MVSVDVAGSKGWLHLDVKYYAARRWFVFWLIWKFRPGGLAEKEVVPFLAEIGRQLGMSLRWPPEPHPSVLLKLFVEDGHLNAQHLTNPGLQYIPSQHGEAEFNRLNELFGFEELLGIGHWSDLQISI